MVRESKKGSYEHLCLLVYGQGHWYDKDRETVPKILAEEREKTRTKPYPFAMKLQVRNPQTTAESCPLCTPLHQFFAEIRGQADGIYFSGHHYMIPEDDNEDMKNLLLKMLDLDIIKKLYLLYVDGFRETKRTELANWNLETLRARIGSVTVDSTEFKQLIEKNEYRPNMLYEITKW